MVVCLSTCISYLFLFAGFRFPGTKKSKYPTGGGTHTGISNFSAPINHAEGDSISKKMSNSSYEKFVAKYSYSATQTDELDLMKGVIIDVISKEADGWWQGKSPDGKIGWFPSNYVEAASESNANDTINSHSQSSHDSKPVLEVVKALYAFRSDNTEELSFELGDLFDIIGKPPSDPEWYEARNTDGKVGLIPRNYVETVPGATSAVMPEQSNYDDVVPDMMFGNNNNVPSQHEQVGLSSCWEGISPHSLNILIFCRIGHFFIRSLR